MMTTVSLWLELEKQSRTTSRSTQSDPQREESSFSDTSRYSRVGRASSYLSHTRFARLWRQLNLHKFVKKYFTRNHGDHASHTTHMRHKSTEEDTPSGEDFIGLEYAVESKILEAPELELSYYMDVAGDVPPIPHSREHSGAEPIDIGNGDIGPEWGIDIIVRGGFLRYGPWADRQR